MDDRQRSTSPPPRRTKTLDGLPSSRPSRPPIADKPRSRLTLSFVGPPLNLDEPNAEGAEWRSAAPPGAGPSPDRGAEDHDAWTTERRRRTTPPPARSGAPSVRSMPPPPLRASRPPFAARRATPSGSLPLSIDESDAYRLIERSRPSLSLDLASEVRERYELGDFSGALRAAELWLGADPENEEAAGYASSCREQLEQFYRARLGSFDRMIHVAVAPSEIRWLGLDHRAAFFLSRVDGMTSIDDLLDLSGMPRLESLKTLVELLDMGAVALERAPR